MHRPFMSLAASSAMDGALTDPCGEKKPGRMFLGAQIDRYTLIVINVSLRTQLATGRGSDRDGGQGDHTRLHSHQSQT